MHKEYAQSILKKIPEKGFWGIFHIKINCSSTEPLSFRSGLGDLATSSLVIYSSNKKMKVKNNYTEVYKHTCKVTMYQIFKLVLLLFLDVCLKVSFQIPKSLLMFWFDLIRSDLSSLHLFGSSFDIS